MKNIAFTIMGLLAFVGVLVGVVRSCWQPDTELDSALVRQNSNPHYPGVLRFRYAKLPEKTLARSGNLTFQDTELRGAGYESTLKEAEEILFALAYKQLLQRSTESKASLGRPPFPRPLAGILNQYGIALNKNIKVEFSDSTESRFYLKVGNLEYSRADIKKENLLWSGVQSRLFRLKLQLAETSLKKKALIAAAQDAKQSLQDYRDEKIFQGQKFSAKEQEVRIAYFLEKYVLDLPIEIALKPPTIRLELKEEWTPSLGRKDSELTVTIFADFYSAGSQVLLENVKGLSEEFPQVSFNFRPTFPRSDRYQLMVAEMAICLWSRDPENFWETLPGLFKARGDRFDKILFSAVKEKSRKMKAIQSCYLKRDHKDVVEYHLETGEFWGVLSLPTVLVGGEAFVGPTTITVLRETIARHLEVPTAAVWSPAEKPKAVGEESSGDEQIPEDADFAPTENVDE